MHIPIHVHARERTIFSNNMDAYQQYIPPMETAAPTSVAERWVEYTNTIANGVWGFDYEIHLIQVLFVLYVYTLPHVTATPYDMSRKPGTSPVTRINFLCTCVGELNVLERLYDGRIKDAKRTSD
jgi:hypothetical protein